MTHTHYDRTSKTSKILDLVITNMKQVETQHDHEAAQTFLYSGIQ